VIAQDGNLDELRAQLREPDVWQQLEAAETIAQQGIFEGRTAILNALGNEDPEVRIRSVILAGHIGARWAIAPTAQLLRDEESSVRGEAIQALLNISRAAVVPWLIEALGDEEEERREDASVSLFQLIGDDVPIQAGIGDEDRDVESTRVREWWQSASAGYSPDLCYYRGRLLSLDEWIARLKSPSVAHQRWVLYRLLWWTGQDFGSDPSAKLARQWAAWWKTNSQRFQTGYRYFYGHLVDE
jgi:hypothetical protein